jgi:hypothetical protein
MNIPLLAPITALAITCALTGAAVASPIYTVDVWIGDLKADHTGGTNADKPLPSVAADAHFTVAGPIDWVTDKKSNLVQNFLTDDGATALPTLSGYTTPSGQYATLASFLGASMSAGGDAYSAFFHITGTYSSLTSFAGSIEHDDGASLYIDNGATKVFGNSPETTAITDTFTLAAGTHEFDLYYVEGNGAPSVLDVVFPSAVVTTTAASVPEPATLALFGVGLLGLSAVHRRNANAGSRVRN